MKCAFQIVQDEEKNESLCKQMVVIKRTRKRERANERKAIWLRSRKVSGNNEDGEESAIRQ